MLHTLAPAIFTPAPGQYENIRFDAAAAETAGTWILAVCIGVVLAALYNFYVRLVPGSVVRALLAADALDAARAKTERELALSRLARLELAHNTVLQRLISSVEGAAGEPTRYFIPEEQKYRAELRFERRGNGVGGLLLTVALTFAAAVLVARLLPWFLGVLDGIL